MATTTIPASCPGCCPTTTRPTSAWSWRDRELDPATKGDVLEVKVVMDMENMTSADLTINNWDDTEYEFKFSETPTFDLGNRVTSSSATPTGW